MNQNESTDNGVKEAGTQGEGFSPSRCPMDEQRKPGRYQATAKTKWNKQMNIAVMECYYMSCPVDEGGKPVRGYRKRMHDAWKERGLMNISEQRLCDQARMIRKNEWFTAVELEEIKRRVTIRGEEMEETTSENEEGEEIIRQDIEQEEEIIVEIVETEDRSEEVKNMIKEIVEIMKNGQKSNVKGWKKVDRNVLNEWTKKVNETLKEIRTENITDTNKLINAVSVYIARKVGLKTGPTTASNNKEPWWKRRIKNSINELRRHINILERNRRGEVRKKGKYLEVAKKYKMKEKGQNVVIEELKQRLQAKAAKLKRYELRIQQFRVNRMFDQDQKRLYQELNGTARATGVTPDADESKIFWSGIWDNEVYHHKEAEWLKHLKEEKGEGRQDDIVITTGMVLLQSKKIPNWKAPRPDGVQGYWIKKLTSLHERIAEQTNDMINNGVQIPEWMTSGRTVLCQKDPKKGNAVDNYRPISCLPLMWKLITGIISETMYKFLDENEILPVEQKGCRRRSRGTKDQLLIDKSILADCKRKHKNLAMARVDYKKAYDMVPHSWIIECLKLTHVAENIINFVERSMSSWRTELTSSGEMLGSVRIRRGIFQGDSLSPLLFVICMIPLTCVLRKARAGYMLDGVKINHLLFMDDLKLFGKNEREVDSLVSTVKMISEDIGMEFGINKCGTATMKRGKLIKSNGIKLSNGETINEVDEKGYKYLGILELDKVKEKEMKEVLKAEYLRRAKLVMRSKLYGRNKIEATNTWAVLS